MIDSRVAHLLDGRALLALLPGLDQRDLPTIRSEFARHLAHPNRYSCWQDAWNAWTAAAPQRPGSIMYTPPACRACSGRGISTRNVGRNLARTGHPAVCGECRGSRRGTRVRQAARWARPKPTP